MEVIKFNVEGRWLSAMEAATYYAFLGDAALSKWIRRAVSRKHSDLMIKTATGYTIHRELVCILRADISIKLIEKGKTHILHPPRFENDDRQLLFVPIEEIDPTE